jgi:hypothetical protein
MLPTTRAKIKSLFDQHKRQDNKHRNSLGLPNHDRETGNSIIQHQTIS